MKPLLALAVLLAFGIAGCSKSDPYASDPYAKYRDAQLTVGMTIADIKQQIGEPDSFEEWWDIHGEKWEVIMPPRDAVDAVEWPPADARHFLELHYGAFGSHSPKKGHVTNHRLSMTFIDGELFTWEKSAPSNRD